MWFVHSADMVAQGCAGVNSFVRVFRFSAWARADSNSSGVSTRLMAHHVGLRCPSGLRMGRVPLMVREMCGR